MIRNVKAILWKQGKDTFKNKEILIQFLMFPLLTVLMENIVKMPELPEHFFVTLFSVMYVGMAPLTSMSAIISEEKEKNTLRVLFMSNVTPMEYLFGVGLYVWSLCMLGAMVFCICGQYKESTGGYFLFLMWIGILVSVLVGAAIGTMSKNQMMATSITLPVMMMFSFLPMLSMFHSGIARLSKLTYSGQIHFLISHMETMEISMESVLVLVVNMVVAGVVFGAAYRRCRVD